MICHDESLWQKINLYQRKVHCEFIKQFLENGCKYLSFSSAEIIGSLTLTKSTELRYLDLTRCKIHESVLEELISACHSLQKLSLDLCLSLNSNIINNINIKNGQTLQVLNLSRCKGLKFDSFHKIIKFCVDLQELNLFDTDLCQQSVLYLVNNVNSKLQVQLSLRHT